MAVSNTERKDVILNEVRKSYEIRFDLKRNLESKATNAITISSIVITLLFGFITFFLRSPLQLNLQDYYYILILFSIAFSLAALFCALRSLRITEYSFVLAESQDDGSRLEEVVDSLLTSDIGDCLQRLIDSYLFSIKINSFQNDRSARRVSLSQTFLFIAILSLGLSVALLAFPFIFKILSTWH